MEAYLSKCLGSLIIEDKELLQKLEVVVVNDGSKDRTSEITHEFAAKYPGVFKVIDKPNGHYGSCINAALPMVCGEYVKVLDADDSVDTVSFERFLRVVSEESAKRDSSADLIVTDYVDVDPDDVISINWLEAVKDAFATGADMVKMSITRIRKFSPYIRSSNVQEFDGCGIFDYGILRGGITFQNFLVFAAGCEKV